MDYRAATPADEPFLREMLRAGFEAVGGSGGSVTLIARLQA